MSCSAESALWPLSFTKITYPDSNKVNVSLARKCALESVGEKLSTCRAALVVAARLDKPLVVALVNRVRESDGLLVSREEDSDL